MEFSCSWQNTGGSAPEFAVFSLFLCEILGTIARSSFAYETTKLESSICDFVVKYHVVVALAACSAPKTKHSLCNAPHVQCVE